jgi:transposase
VSTIEDARAMTGRRRPKHSAEFKARAVDSCKQPVVPMAAVALANCINANLLRRWFIEDPVRDAAAAPVRQRSDFVALLLPTPAQTLSTVPDIRVEVRRSAMTVTIA